MIEGKISSAIGPGILVLLGVKKGDEEVDSEYLAERCIALRIFDDQNGKMNCSLNDVGGEIMVVSQFTLYGDTRKGNRPSYMDAAMPEQAEALYNSFVNCVRKKLGDDRVATGVFRAMMDVELVNDGPVTILIESKSKDQAAVG